MGSSATTSIGIAPWKHLLVSAVQSNSHLKHSSYFQLATIGSNGRPSNRTVVFRGFQDDTDKIQINTDTRTRKVDDLKHCPYAEQREKTWFASSLRSRLQYLGPTPGIPSVAEETLNSPHIDPSTGPVDEFCLLVIDPHQVDYLNLKSSDRLTFTSTTNSDGEKLWNSDKVNP